MAEIIATQPWSENGAWFTRNFWYDPETNSFSVDEYSDGDHEDCNEKDVPEPEKLARDWLEYHRYVAETGEDPLGEFMVQRTRKVKKVWFVSIAKTADGTPYLSRIKHAGRYYSPFDLKALPEYVKEYCLVKESSGLQMELDVSWSELEKELGSNLSKLNRIEIEHNVPVAEAVVRHQLLKRARKAVKEEEAALHRRDTQVREHDAAVPQEPAYTGPELTIRIRLVEGGKAHVTATPGNTDCHSTLETLATDVAGVVSGWLEYIDCEGDTEDAHLAQLELGYAHDRT